MYEVHQVEPGTTCRKQLQFPCEHLIALRNTMKISRLMVCLPRKYINKLRPGIQALHSCSY